MHLESSSLRLVIVPNLVAVWMPATNKTRSQAVARIADRTAVVGVTWPRPHPLSAKIICAPTRHCPYKAAYQIWSL